MSKKIRHSCIVKIIILVAVSIAFSLFVELIANWKLMRLDSSQAGRVISCNETADGYEVGIEGYVEKLIIDFTCKDAAYFTVDVELLNKFGYQDTKTIDDKNSAFMDFSVVDIGAVVKKITIAPYEAADYMEMPVITGVQIKNVAAVNGYRMAFVILLILTPGLLILFREYLAKHIEVAFLIIALSAGCFMTASLPVTRVGWDEDTHLKGAFLLNYTGHFSFNQFTQDYIISFFNNNPFEHSVGIEELSESYKVVNELSRIHEGDTVYTTGIHHSGFATFSYMFMGFTFTICKLFKIPLGTSIMLVRFTDLFMYIALIFFAIRKLPKGKLLMAAIALMPTPLYIACTASYDTTVTGFMYLGLAYLFAPILEERQITWKEFWIYLFAVGFACIPKAVYIPIILLGLFAPHKCFKDKKTEKVMKSIIVLACIVGLSTFVLPTLISPADTGDTRAGDTSHSRSMAIILSQPFDFAVLLLKRIKETFCDYTLGSSSLDLMAYMGRGTGTFFIIIYLVLLTATGENTELVKDANGSRTYGFRPYFKYILWVLTFGVVCLIWVAMYMAYTVVGRYDIDGVQGRYYIPFLFPVLFTLSFNKIQVAYDRKKYSLVCLLVSTAIIFFAIGQLILPSCI